MLVAFAALRVHGIAIASEKPVTVCEVLKDTTEYTGRTVAVLGRFSFRERGRFLSEDKCALKPEDEGAAWASAFSIVMDDKNGPRPEAGLEFDSRDLYERLARVKRSTALGRFRFGTPEYDRWAVVYARVEFAPNLRSGPKESPAGKREFEPAAGRLVCRSDALIVFIPDR